jgi:hypothetical protein
MLTYLIRCRFLHIAFPFLDYGDVGYTLFILGWAQLILGHKWWSIQIYISYVNYFYYQF